MQRLVLAVFCVLLLQSCNQGGSNNEKTVTPYKSHIGFLCNLDGQHGPIGKIYFEDISFEEKTDLMRFFGVNEKNEVQGNFIDIGHTITSDVTFDTSGFPEQGLDSERLVLIPFEENVVSSELFVRHWPKRKDGYIQFIQVNHVKSEAGESIFSMVIADTARCVPASLDERTNQIKL